MELTQHMDSELLTRYQPTRTHQANLAILGSLQGVLWKSIGMEAQRLW